MLANPHSRGARLLDRPIARGLAGPGLLAHVLVGNYCDHLPLHRQSAIYAREGVDLARSTLAEWVGECAELLAPLTKAIRRHALAGNTLHADDTPVPVLEPGRGSPRTGRLWTYVRDERPAGSELPAAVWFAWSPDRKGIHPQRHLRDFRGTLHADGYAGYGKLFEQESIRESDCWAHARRKSYDVHAAQPETLTATALALIAEIYAVEERVRGRPPDVRRLARQAHAAPLLTRLRTWQKHPTRTGCRMRNKSDRPHWPALLELIENEGRITLGCVRPIP